MSAQRSQKTYKIGEAARKLGLKSYVLRFWESEFPQLEPVRTQKGQRLYNEEHLVLLQRIKALLYDQGMTIEGARRRLDETEQWSAFLNELRRELLEIKDLVSAGVQEKDNQ